MINKFFKLSLITIFTEMANYLKIKPKLNKKIIIF